MVSTRLKTKHKALLCYLCLTCYWEQANQGLGNWQKFSKKEKREDPKNKSKGNSGKLDEVTVLYILVCLEKDLTRIIILSNSVTNYFFLSYLSQYPAKLEKL